MGKKRVLVAKVRMASVAYSDHLHNHGSVEVTESFNGEGFFTLVHGESEAYAIELTWSQWKSLKLSVKAIQKGAKEANKKANKKAEKKAKFEPTDGKPGLENQDVKKKKSQPKIDEKPSPEVDKANG